MNDKTEPAPKPSKASQFEIPRGVPVKLVRFTRSMQVPGKQADDTAKSETLPNGRSWTIEYIPQIRHHKITYTDPGRQKEPEVGFVHECHVLAWWPAAL